MAADKIEKTKPDLWKVLNKAMPTYRPPGGAYDDLSQLAFLGAVGPDLPAYNEDDLGSLFDMCHHKKTGTLVANMLEQVSDEPSGSERNAMNAFTLGYMCHIAGDIICHPYVNNFAGEYEKQAISRVFRFHVPRFGIPPWEGKDVAMHMYSEMHQDTYVAMTHYGCGDELSNGPGDSTWNSWSDFLNDLLTSGLGSTGHSARGMGREVLEFFHGVLDKTFPKQKVQYSHLEDALGIMFDALDLGYDTAAGPAMDEFVRDYVEHEFYRDVWYTYERFLGAAADVTANAFWPAAATYLEFLDSADSAIPDKKKQARKDFLKAMCNWNLDTGYRVRVYSVDNIIHVRYEHSWAKYLT